MNPAVTIIMPKLLRGQFVPIIDAMLADQTFRDFELIVVEERWSSEQSPAIREARYRIVETAEHSLIPIGHKYNLGHQWARGRYILQMNSDDYYAPNYIRRCVELLATATVCGHDRFTKYNLLDRMYGTIQTPRGQCGHFFYRREVARKVRYPLVQHIDDKYFAENVEREGITLIPVDMSDLLLVMRHTAKVRDWDAWKRNKAIGDARLDGGYCYPSMKNEGCAASVVEDDNDPKGYNYCGSDIAGRVDSDYDFLRGFVKNERILDFYMNYKVE